jgi:hypothetical protein
MYFFMSDAVRIDYLVSNQYSYVEVRTAAIC